MKQNQPKPLARLIQVTEQRGRASAAQHQTASDHCAFKGRAIQLQEGLTKSARNNETQITQFMHDRSKYCKSRRLYSRMSSWRSKAAIYNFMIRF
jgi:hypothetical protein